MRERGEERKMLNKKREKVYSNKYFNKQKTDRRERKERE